MYPTLSNKDYLFVSKTATINRGDIVIVKKDNSERYLVKRVIGVSNDSVKFSSEGVSVNDTLLNEDYINTAEEVTYANYSEVVGADSYYVLGDNRNHSSDSRIFGDVKSSEIIGVVKFNLSSLGVSQTHIRVVFVILAVCLICYKPRKSKKEIVTEDIGE